MPRLFTVCVLVLFSFSGYAQRQGTVIDSLMQSFPQIVEREKQEIIFDQLNDELALLEKQEAFSFALKIRTLAEESKAPYSYFFASMNLAKLSNRFQDQDNALRYMLTGIAYTLNNEEPIVISYVHHYAAEYFKFVNMLPLALEHCLKAAEAFTELKNFTFASRSHSLACHLYHTVKNYSQSVEEGLASLAEIEKVSSDSLSYIDKFTLMSTNNTIGLSSYKLKNFDQSLFHYAEAERLARALKNEFWIALIHGNRASVYIELKEFDKALEGLRLDLKTSKKYKEFESAARASVLISSIYIQLNNLKTANLYFDSVKYLIDDPHAFRFSTYWLVQSKLRQAKGDLLGALESYDIHLRMIDSINYQKEALNLASVKTTYELQKKQRAIELLAAKEQQQQDQIRTQRVIIFSSVIILVLLIALIIIYIRYVQRLKVNNAIIKQQRDEIESKNEELEVQSKNLKEINDLMLSLNNQLELKVSERTHELEKTMEELDTFLYRSSHDMRRPLSTLLGLENIAKIEVKEESGLKLFHMVAETALQMDRMLLKMQMAHELDQMEDNTELVTLSYVIKDLVKRTQQLGTNTDIIYEGPRHIELFSNTRLLHIVFYNLFENAINFRRADYHEASYIKVSISETTNWVVVTIEDNGIGIDAEYLGKIFDQYFKGTQLSKGNGLGLYLVKKAVAKLRGKIKVKSVLGEGTIFTVYLPK
jgi:signal transduction histidine kinase